jgi:enoyl-CoA hydratase
MLDFEVRDRVAWLTLQRPKVLNAINRELANSVYEKIKELENRSDVRAIVTRGAGKAFCAGSDLRELSALTPDQATQYELRFAEIFNTLSRLPQATIAMLHGHVLGGGLGLAVYHDFRIASINASLGMPEVQLGWIPPWSLGRFAEIVGFAQARWLLITCNPISGARAAEIGLVNEAVPEDQLVDKVEDLATRLAAMPPKGVTQTKQLLNDMSNLRDFHWDQRAAEDFRDCYSTPEAQRSVAGFINKKNCR